ncbi:Sec-independent protein translocase protein TatB [Microvirga pudoricolor]|uniref:Sec-independent protein translocase protein TatB n=1 Tax=Microvirga pudoricolor TaxID=2778729 RepID=UPI001950C186|nr:Sec-independent protein translocase protein TatB [Microvirga pudoricolor]MBM6596121.1 twin-arginine translocase subunit TatB [Microvirga pudoricolor]
MLDMSWGEIMVIGAVALIVIGPKDLPKALRTVGNVTGKIRRMAAEFQGQFNEAMREAELDEVKQQLQGMNNDVAKGFNPIQTIRNEIKGSIEAPVTAPEKSATETVSDAMAQGRGEAGPVAPIEPPIDLVVPAVPPIVDPAESIAATLRQEADARAAEERAAAAAAETTTAPDHSTAKPDAKA